MSSHLLQTGLSGLFSMIGDKAQRLGTGIASIYNDDAKRAQAAIVFNSLRYKPDPKLAQSLENRLGTLRTANTTNRTVEWLKSKNLGGLADMLTNNPHMATDITKAAMTKLGYGSIGMKTSQIFTDQVTGQQYTVTTDANTGEIKKVPIEGASQLTYEQKFEIADEAAIKKADILLAQQAGGEAFAKAQEIESQLGLYDRAYDALEKGAASGPIASKFFAFNEQTALLGSIVNLMGISVINMATFGALSEREMQMAMRTNLDLMLPPEDLKKMILEIMAARRKLMVEFYKTARLLSSGTLTKSQYNDQISAEKLRDDAAMYYRLNAAEKMQISEDKWSRFNLEKREEFISLRGD